MYETHKPLHLHAKFAHSTNRLHQVGLHLLMQRLVESHDTNFHVQPIVNDFPLRTQSTRIYIASRRQHKLLFVIIIMLTCHNSELITGKILGMMCCVLHKCELSPLEANV